MIKNKLDNKNDKKNKINVRDEMKFNKKTVMEIINLLEKEYPDAQCSLYYRTNFELLVAVMLSAQCTDERVNIVTSILFDKYNTAEKIKNMNLSLLEEIIKPCGFYKVKAKNIQNSACILIDKFSGTVPNSIEKLMELPGVGRKTANVIMSEAFNNPQGIAVDTHVKRVSTRLGFSKERTPEKIEFDLLKIIPKEYFKQINHLLIYHGRACCKAPTPKCNNCVLRDYCIFYNS